MPEQKTDIVSRVSNTRARILESHKASHLLMIALMLVAAIGLAGIGFLVMRATLPVEIPHLFN